MIKLRSTAFRGRWLVAALLFSTGAYGQNAVDVEVRSEVKRGESPAVILSVRQPLSEVRLQLHGEGPGAPSQPVFQRRGRLESGARVELRLPRQEKSGQIKWQGKLFVRFARGGEGEMPLSFITRAQGEIRVKMNRENLDLQNHHMTFTMDRPAQKAEVKITGDDGKLVAETKQEFFGEAPGTPLQVMWQPLTKSPVLCIQLVVYDMDGFHQRVDYFPWQIDIPHEEVIFETGKAEMRPEQKPKLEAVLPVLKKTQKRYGAAVKLAGQRMKLFIAGHTDTVGSKKSNQALSKRRARTIADWFWDQGVDIPIYFQGCGEERPRIATADERAEEQNRRVDYTVALESPHGALKTWRLVR